MKKRRKTNNQPNKQTNKHTPANVTEEDDDDEEEEEEAEETEGGRNNSPLCLSVVSALSFLSVCSLLLFPFSLYAREKR